MLEDFATPYYYTKETRKKKNKTLRIFLIFFVLGICSYFILTSISSVQSNKVIAGLSARPEYPTPTIINEENGLSKLVEATIGNSKAIFGVVIVDLDSDVFYVKNQNRIFTSASLYKLWVLAVSLEMIESKKLGNENALRANNIELYQRFNLASPSAEMHLEYSVENALERMITVSDNNTALLLSARIGLSNISTFLEREKMTKSKLGTGTVYPSTTAYDTAVFLKKIYDGELVSIDASQTMVELLKKQRLNNKIPKYLPEDTVIAHKTGELDEFSHDAGIIFTDKGDYILVILSESPNDVKRTDTEDEIARLSEAVYNYFLTN